MLTSGSGREPSFIRATVARYQPDMTRASPLIGVGFAPDILDRALLDEVMVVTDDDAMTAARRLVRGEGILAGVSSGAVVHAALMIASRRDEIGKMIVVVLPDSAERCGTTVTIVECRPPWRGTLGPSGRVSRSSSTTTRRVPSGALYWHDRNLRWHSYDRISPVSHVDDCLPRSTRIRRRSSGLDRLRGAASCGRPGRPSGPA